MKALFENDINHNAALGAVMLWSFAKAYFEQRSRTAGPQLHELMLALPIAFHPASVAAIHARNRDGALPKALAESRVISAGLQERVRGFSGRTLRALNLALASDLLSFDRSGGSRFPPSRLTRPFVYSSEELNQMAAAADRLGHWTALSGFQTACTLLGVRY
jgi:hypothetical protein